MKKSITVLEQQMSGLSSRLNHREGLHYPTSIKLADGTIVKFNSYAEHHQFIQNILKD